jgi:hypothetical protein
LSDNLLAPGSFNQKGDGVSVSYLPLTLQGMLRARAFPNPSGLPPKFLEQIRVNEEQQASTVFNTFRNQAQSQRTPAVPVTIIWGHVSLAGAGHMPQVEAAGEFVKAVKKLVSNGEGGGVPK